MEKERWSLTVTLSSSWYCKLFTINLLNIVIIRTKTVTLLNTESRNIKMCEVGGDRPLQPGSYTRRGWEGGMEGRSHLGKKELTLKPVYFHFKR